MPTNQFEKYQRQLAEIAARGILDDEFSIVEKWDRIILIPLFSSCSLLEQCGKKARKHVLQQLGRQLKGASIKEVVQFKLDLLEMLQVGSVGTAFSSIYNLLNHIYSQKVASFQEDLKAWLAKKAGRPNCPQDFIIVQLFDYLELSPDLNSNCIDLEGVCYGLAFCESAMFLAGASEFWHELLAHVLLWSSKENKPEDLVRFTDGKEMSYEEVFNRVINSIVYHQVCMPVDYQMPEQAVLTLPNGGFELDVLVGNEGFERHVIHDRVSAVGNFYQESLAILLRDSLLKKEDCIVLISNTKHTCSLMYNSDKRGFEFYDSNLGTKSCSEEAIDLLSSEIIQCLGYKIAISVSTTSPDEKLSFNSYKECLKEHFDERWVFNNEVRELIRDFPEVLLMLLQQDDGKYQDFVLTELVSLIGFYKEVTFYALLEFALLREDETGICLLEFLINDHPDTILQLTETNPYFFCHLCDKLIINEKGSRLVLSLLKIRGEQGERVTSFLDGSQLEGFWEAVSTATDQLGEIGASQFYQQMGESLRVRGIGLFFSPQPGGESRLLEEGATAPFLENTVMNQEACLPGV